MADAKVASTADILPTRQGPALSAVSDMPIPGAAKSGPPIAVEAKGALSVVKPVAVDIAKPEPAEGVAPVVETQPDATAKKPDAGATEGDAPAKEAETVETEGKEAAPEKAEDAKADETPAWQKREITKARNKERAERDARVAAEAKADAVSAQLTLALDALKQAGGKTAETTADPRPDRTKYDDPNKYEVDLTGWAERQGKRAGAAETEAKIAADTAKIARETQERQAADSFKAIQTKYQETATKFAESHPDFEEVTQSDDVTISEAMAAAIMQADNGPHIAYHLGSNAKEAARIAALPTLQQQIMEIGKLSVKLETKPNISLVPKPIRPLGTKAAAVAKSPDEMSMDEYAAARNAKIMAERRDRLGIKVN
jgi:hypothetical protein